MRNPWLCVINISALSLGALGSTAGLVWISATGKDPPAALWTMAAALWGALSSFLVTPPRGSNGGGDKANP